MTHSGASNSYHIKTIRATANDEPAGLAFVENTTERMRIDSAGNVGIGAVPGVKLHVEGNTDSNVMVVNNIGTAPNYIFDVRDDGVSKFRVDPSGNIGIGTSSPSSFDQRVTAPHLVVGSGSNSAGVTVYSGTSAQGSINFADGTTTTQQYEGGLVYAHSTNHMSFHTNGGTEAIRIDSSQNLLVGVSTFANNTLGVAIRGASSGATDESIRCAVPSTGSTLQIGFYNANGRVGSISTSGSATAYNTSSDQRLKDNIVDAPSASDDIDAIQVRSFDWKVDGSHQKYGMVAQELQTVAPEAVAAPEDPEEMMGVDYSKLVPMLVKEIQSLRARVAQLEGAN